MTRTSQFRIVLVTCGSMREARKIANAIVKRRLAACVNILTAPVESVYVWRGRNEKAREHLLIIKSSLKRLKPLERVVLRLHSYETPEFISLRIAGGSPAYLSWLAGSLRE